MNEIFEGNLAVVGQRWPALAELLAAQDIAAVPADLREGQESTLAVKGIQLSSRHDRAGEAAMQAASVAADTPVIYLYGPGLGELPVCFLQRPSLQRLVVRLLNETVFALILHLIDQRAWLADPRVELALAGDDGEIGHPCFALPPELVLASDANAKMRDRLVADLMVSFVNRRFLDDDGHIAHLRTRFASNRPLLENDHDVGELFASRPGSEVWVIATGPTLARHYETLRAARARPQMPFLIAVDTALVPLLNQGIRPDLVVSADHLTSMRTLPPEQSTGLPLVYFPMLDTLVLAAWQGPRYAAYSASPLYDTLRQEIPKAALYAGGSVLHIAVDLAVRMGARQIVLFGADFAFVDDRAHAGWESGILAPEHVTAEWVLNGYGQRVTTLLNLRAYLCTLERYIAAHPAVRFLNASRAGAVIAGADYHPELVQ
ncbi:MAG: 6-hydroxymethylpterin diphosphokinase MptE-like protein [Azonexus sp.]